MTTSIPLPRYEAWPLRRKPNDHSGHPEVYPAQVRKVWYDDKGRRCMGFVIECDGETEEEDGEMAAVCAVALAAHFGGIADTSRIKVN